VYEAVLIYNTLGGHQGYGIRRIGADRLHSVNYYDETGVTEQLNALNNSEVVKENWPDLNDPEVRLLIDDPDWEPLRFHEEEVFDIDKSELVSDPLTGEVDWERSTLVKVRKMVPDSSVEVQQRTRKALETVAMARAGLLQ
jgi:hypothetical protein